MICKISSAVKPLTKLVILAASHAMFVDALVSVARFQVAGNIAIARTSSLHMLDWLGFSGQTAPHPRNLRARVPS